MKIHHEGYNILIPLALILIATGFWIFEIMPNVILSYMTILITGIFFLFFLQFFRNPKRKINTNEKYILAPADGKIVACEQVYENEYLNKNTMQISIFMSPLNVHSNKNPVTGIIKKLNYEKGNYFAAYHPKSSTENERNNLIYQMEDGTEILVRQIAGLLARRIKCYVNEKEYVKQGEEFGFIKFGSRVDVFIPLNAKLNLEINQKSIGGKTVLAMFE